MYIKFKILIKIDNSIWYYTLVWRRFCVPIVWNVFNYCTACVIFEHEIFIIEREKNKERWWWFTDIYMNHMTRNPKCQKAHTIPHVTLEERVHIGINCWKQNALEVSFEQHNLFPRTCAHVAPFLWSPTLSLVWIY